MFVVFPFPEEENPIHPLMFPDIGVPLVDGMCISIGRHDLKYAWRGGEGWGGGTEGG